MKIKVPFFHNGELLELPVDTSDEVYQNLLIIDDMQSTYSELSDTITDNGNELKNLFNLKDDLHRVLDKLDSRILDAKNYFCAKNKPLISKATTLEMQIQPAQS